MNFKYFIGISNYLWKKEVSPNIFNDFYNKICFAEKKSDPLKYS